MGCFSLNWIEQILIWLVIVCAVVGILRLVIPFVLAQLGAAGGIIMAVLNILMWAVICIFVIYFCFAVISCLLGSGGLALPHLSH
jgi:hypothetical protein